MAKFQKSDHGAVATREALRRAGLDDDPRVENLKNVIVEIRSKQGYIEEIGKLWADAQKKFLLIGIYLKAAKEKLEHGEFEAMIEAELPFGKNVAHRLRKVADAVIEGRLEEKEIPANWSTVYELAALTDQQLTMARERNLVRPDVSRDEVRAFKRLLLPTRLVTDRRGDLERRREKLRAEMERLQAELAEIEQELSAEVIEGESTVIDVEAEMAASAE